MNKEEIIISTKNQIVLLKRFLNYLPWNNKVRIETEYLISLSERLIIELEK
jgi:hypothetical protein